MKFVHLTSQADIARIKRNGIRCGGGRRGRGVYAVPLMWMRQITATRDDRFLQTTVRSSMTLWQWLAGQGRRHRNMAAIVFADAASHWPAALYIELPVAVGTDWLKTIHPDEASVAEADLHFVQGAHQQGLMADLKISIHCSKGLGAVMHAVASCGYVPCSQYDDSIELVLPEAVPPHLIETIIPLYRTNQAFKIQRSQSGEPGAS